MLFSLFCFILSHPKPPWKSVKALWLRNTGLYISLNTFNILGISYRLNAMFLAMNRPAVKKYICSLI